MHMPSQLDFVADADLSQELDWLALWVPPILSTIVDTLLLVMQIDLVWKTDRALPENMSAVVAIAGRQL